jgi:hypothetical protein
MPDMMTERRLQALEQFVERLRKSDMGSVQNTWTPAFQGSGTAGTFTYSVQSGVYTRLGNQVIVHARVAISAISVAPTGTMRITGLPYTANATYFGGCYFTFISNFNYAASAMDVSGLIGPSTAHIRIMESFDNTSAADTPAANFTNVNCDLMFSGVYLIA